MPKVVVLGAGFGGLAAAYSLRKLSQDNIEITVISDSERYAYRPSLPDVALGAKSLEDICIPLPQALSGRGIRFVKTRVQQIAARSSVVQTETAAFPYDYLVVAIGSEIAFQEIKGAKEYGYVLCEANAIMNLRKAMENFPGGPVATVLTQDNPFELMDIGFTLSLDHLLRQRGLRSQSPVHYFTPNKLPLPYLGEKSRGVLLEAFRRRGVEIHPQRHLQEVRKDTIVCKDGTEFPSFLSVLIPPYQGRRVVAESELSDERGYIPTDRDMRSLKFENVYAVGDAVSFAGPKSGRRAMIQGKVAARNIAARIKGQKDSVKFEEQELRCIIEMGGSKAAYIRSNAYWGGTSERIWVGMVPYWMKVWLEKRFLWKKGNL